MTLISGASLWQDPTEFTSLFDWKPKNGNKFRPRPSSSRSESCWQVSEEGVVVFAFVVVVVRSSQ